MGWFLFLFLFLKRLNGQKNVTAVDPVENTSGAAPGLSAFAPAA
jgi:hypothetical protein